MHNYSNEDSLFLQTEIREIKKVRNGALIFFGIVYLIFLGFLLYNLRGRSNNFLIRQIPLFVYPTILFGGLSWGLCIKNRKYINALQELNSHDLDIYRQYLGRLIPRHIPIAPYLFCANELIFFSFFTNKRVSLDQIQHIETKIIHNYRGPDSYRVYFYNESMKKIRQVTMHQRQAFDFVQEQLLKEIPNLSILARNH